MSIAGGKAVAASSWLAVIALLVPVLACAMAREPVAVGLPSSVAFSAVTSLSAVAEQSAERRPTPRSRDCQGTGYRIIPARGDISNLSGTEGGQFWWQDDSRSGVVCIGTVRMWVDYPRREYVHWLVVIYAAHALRDFIGSDDLTLNAGDYYRDFPVRQEFVGADSLCLIAEFGAGRGSQVETSCVTLG